MITKEEILDIIEEDIEQVKEDIKNCSIFNVDSTSFEQRLKDLLFTEKYISQIVDQTDLEEEKSAEYMPFKY